VKISIDRLSIILTILVSLTLAANGCQTQTTPTTQHTHPQDILDPSKLSPVALGPGQKLQVTATTNIVGDVVRHVGGDRIALTTLMSIGVDPHTYTPTPADTARVHDAHVVFANGAGLEEFLQEMLDNAGGRAIQVRLSDGLELRQTGDAREHGSADPHVWLDVQNVIHWVETIRDALGALDPANAASYQANAQAYTQELEALDAWIVAQMATIPESNRKLVTSHPAFGYLADRYGLEQIGAVYPISPSSEPSAQDIAQLETIIRSYSVPAVFTESTINPKLAEQVARDTGVELAPLYSGSLGGPGSGVESYIALMRYDAQAIVEALK
jgi:manganese/iron transport system substrate-binding protein